LILGKSTTAVAIMPPELHFLTPIGMKSFVGWGFAPDSTGGAYSAPPDFLAIFRGLLLKKGEMRGEQERREGKGKESWGEKGMREEGKGGKGVRPLP